MAAYAVQWQHGQCSGSTCSAVPAQAVRWLHRQCGGRTGSAVAAQAVRWLHRQCSFRTCSAVAWHSEGRAFLSHWTRTESLVICGPACKWSSGGTALCMVGGNGSQFDLSSLTPLSIAGCGSLQTGAPHQATSVALLQVVDNLANKLGGRFSNKMLLAIRDFTFFYVSSEVVIRFFCIVIIDIFETLVLSWVNTV